MAGDTYSFVIENFQEKNIGRYSITAENASGRATCSAELLYEGSDFDSSNLLAPLNAHSQITYSEQIITESSFGDGNVIKESKLVRESQASGGNTVSSETKSIETIPIRQLSPPRSTFIPVTMKDMSIQSSSSSHLMDTRERGVQIQSDLVDRASQMDDGSFIRTVMVDESSQWSKSPDAEIERFSNLVHNESAPFVSTKEESRFVAASLSSSAFNQQQSSSFSYMKKSCSFNNQQAASSSSSHETQTQTSTNLPVHSDFSTTLIKDVNQSRHQHHHHHGHGHFEPVELIINHHGGDHLVTSSSSTQQQQCTCDMSTCSTCIREFDTSCFIHRPVNMIIHKPICHCRSGSLPPLISRLNFKPCSFATTTHSEFDHTDTEDESSFYYYADRSFNDKENFYQSKSKITTSANHNCCCSAANRCCCNKQQSLFKPVELVIGASSLDTGKRIRDTSLPTRISKRVHRMPAKHQKSLITSSFIYDKNNFNNCDFEYDYENDLSINSDFISDRVIDKRESRNKYASFRSSEVEEKQIIGNVGGRGPEMAPRYPTMEMTFDLKTPPTIDVPLRNITVKEGHIAKLECTVGGELNNKY
jgi:hypothetical protein